MRSLDRQLSIVLLLTGAVFATLFWYTLKNISTRSEQEAAQQLYAPLASQLAAHLSYSSEGHLDSVAIKDAFHTVMMVSPALELYILDADGNVKVFDAPSEAVVRSHLDIAPVQAFVNGSTLFPLFVGDPRDRSQQKIFSAASLTSPSGLQGYLLIIIGSQLQQHVADAVNAKHQWKQAIAVLMFAFMLTLGVALYSFKRLTLPLRLLAASVETLKDPCSDTFPVTSPKVYSSSREINILWKTVQSMWENIGRQVQAIEDLHVNRLKFLGQISHDLRTPLTALHLQLEALQHKAPADFIVPIDDCLGRCDHIAARIASLMEYANLSLMDSLNAVEDFCITDVLSDLSQMLQPLLLKHQVKLEIQQLPPAWVKGDIAKFQRLMQNLLENAMRHSPPGGTVHVQIARDSTHNICVAVCDEGPGIAEDLLTDIFTPFIQGKAKKGSMGLGLAISHQIVRLHGGELTVKILPKRGCCFQFSLSESNF